MATGFRVTNALWTVWVHALGGCGVGWDWFCWKLPWDIINGYHGYHQLHHQLDDSMDNIMDNIKIVEIVKQDWEIRFGWPIWGICIGWGRYEPSWVMCRWQFVWHGVAWELTLQAVLENGILHAELWNFEACDWKGLGWVLFHQKIWLDATLSYPLVI